MSRVLVVSSDRTGPDGHAISLGDCLLTDALLERLRAAGHEVAAADFGSTPRADGSRVMLGGLRDLARAIRTSDHVVVGGGTMLQDDIPGRRFGGLPRLCLAVAVVAAAARVPVTYLAVGCDPIANRVQRFALAAAVRTARAVWVRDARSQLRVREQLHRRAELGADAALLRHGGSAGIDPADRKGCVVALNRVDAEVLDAGVVHALAERHGGVTFLAMDQGPESDTVSLPTATATAFDTLTAELAVDDAFELCASTRLVIASRMHALYVAALVDAPMVAVGTAAKVLSFAAEFDVPVAGVVEADLTGRRADPVALDAAADRAEGSVAAFLRGLGPAAG